MTPAGAKSSPRRSATHSVAGYRRSMPSMTPTRHPSLDSRSGWNRAHDLLERLPLVERLLTWARVDFPPTRRFPTALRIAAATLVAVVGSLAIDALLVAIGVAAFPATKGYGHFQFSDYAKLTVLGVLVACAAWPLVARASSSARWLFVRMAVVVTLVLYLPDLYLLAQGQSHDAVAVLMLMHLAIAVVTYNALVRIAPARRF